MSADGHKRAATRLLISMIVAMFLIGCLAVLAPARILNTNHVLVVIQSWVNAIADVQEQASISSFPFASAVSYAGALVLAIVFGVVAQWSSQRTAFKAVVRRGMPRINSVLLWLFIGIILAAPFCLPLSVSEHQFSHRFFEWVANSRIGLLIWTEMVFVFFYAAALWFFAQIAIWLKWGHDNE